MKMLRTHSLLEKSNIEIGEDGRIKTAALFADKISLSVHDRLESVQSDWLELEKTALVSVYQRYQWVESYLKSKKEHEKIQPFVVVGRLEDEIVFILPLQIHGKFLKRLKFIGGSHSNFNLGIFQDRFAKVMSHMCFEKIIGRVRRLVPGVGYLSLCCQPDHWHGTANPLSSLPHQRSSNPAFFIDLKGGFEAVLDRGNGKRKRKKFRQQLRQTEELGGYSLVKPATLSEASQIIDIFLAQKSQRLQEQGIRDVFADDSVRCFLIDLAVKSFDLKDPLLQLYALKVDNKIAAVFGGGVNNNHLSGFFSSIDGDHFAELSPGEMLLYLVVQDACDNGIETMDLGGGDERYKRSWSSETVEMFDVFMSFNALGAPIVGMRRIYGRLRRMLRKHEAGWAFYKKLRRIKTILPV